jgi:hypothetical protein
MMVPIFLEVIKPGLDEWRENPVKKVPESSTLSTRHKGCMGSNEAVLRNCGIKTAFVMALEDICLDIMAYFFT